MNLPGWRTARKLVVFESDDWGSIRGPSPEVYQELVEMGYQPHRSPYLKYDTLATAEDLEMLFSVLRSSRDRNGNPAVFTANCILQNPDFNKIRENGFREYYPELFTETLKRYPGCAGSFDLWKAGMKEGIFRPQYHGREHVNVNRWMEALKKGDPMLHEAFDRQMITIGSLYVGKGFNYMGSLDYFTEEEKQEKRGIVSEGLDLFRRIFNYRSTTFIANNYTWGSYLEDTLVSKGISCIKGMAHQIEPVLDRNGHHFRYRFRYTGMQTASGVLHLVRNTFFEPSFNDVADPLEDCLRRIEIAFRWRKPAVICTHRLNYVGTTQPENRDRSLYLLKKLLHRMIRKWPDVEFVSSDYLCRIISQDGSSHREYEKRDHSLSTD